MRDEGQELREKRGDRRFFFFFSFVVVVVRRSFLRFHFLSTSSSSSLLSEKLTSQQIVAGVLSKYDFGKAWRPRLFVLHPGVGLLAYYKLRAAGVGGGGGLGSSTVAASVFGGGGGGGGSGGSGAAASGGSDAAALQPPSSSDPDVVALLDGLRLEGEVSMIGAQVSVLEDQWRHRRQKRRQQQQAATLSSSSSPASSLPNNNNGINSNSNPQLLLEPAGEVALQVASFSASRTDRRKLYVHAGTRKIAVRAETAEDRWAWLDALAAAKEGLPPLASPGLRPALSTAAAVLRASSHAGGGGGGGRACGGDGSGDSSNNNAAASASASSSSGPTARALRTRLQELGASSAAADEAAKALDDARRAASAAAHAAAAAERRELLARVARLENDKRQLETALVVERELANSSSGGGGGCGGTASSSPLSSSSRSLASSSSIPPPSAAAALSPGGRLVGWARSGAAALLGGRGTSLASPSPTTVAAAAGPGLSLLARRRQRRRLRQQLKQQQQQRGAGGGAAPAEGGGGRGTASANASSVASSVAESTDDGFDEDESSSEEDDSDDLSSSEDEEIGQDPAATAAAAAAAVPSAASASAVESNDAFFDAEEKTEEAAGKFVSRPATPPWLSRARREPSRAAVAHRTALPEPEQREASVPLWSIIRECVGRDLTRVCLPVYFNEPLSALQKIAEEMEYSELLDEAAALPESSVERLLKVAAFAVSAYSGSTPLRTRKPFNPLLSETFELVRPDKGFRFLAEKVVHHPTVVAAAAEGRGWSFSGDADVRSKFWGRSIELTPAGLLTLRFDGGEEFTWKKVVTSISGLILGRLHVDHGGVMRVASASSGLTAVLRFKEPGLFSSSSSSRSSKISDGVLDDFQARHAVVSNQAHEVRGHVEDSTNGRLASPLIVGSWSESLSAVYLGGESHNNAAATAAAASSNGGHAKSSTAASTSTKKHVLLWRCSPPPPDPTRYCLTSFAISLNEITAEEEGRMAPTDSRLRPDQRCLELGIHDRANAEKQRLERKQRAARAAADRGEQIRPRWFETVNEGSAPGEAPLYRFTGEYWRCRELGAYPRCRDIFGEEDNSGCKSAGGSAASTPRAAAAASAASK